MGGTCKSSTRREIVRATPCRYPCESMYFSCIYHYWIRKVRSNLRWAESDPPCISRPDQCWILLERQQLYTTRQLRVCENRLRQLENSRYGPASRDACTHRSFLMPYLPFYSKKPRSMLDARSGLFATALARLTFLRLNISHPSSTSDILDSQRRIWFDTQALQIAVANLE